MLLPLLHLQFLQDSEDFLDGALEFLRGFECVLDVLLGYLEELPLLLLLASLLHDQQALGLQLGALPLLAPGPYVLVAGVGRGLA